MGSIVADEDFAILLVSSLPESWDSHELVAILLEEDRRWKERTGDPHDVAMQGRVPNRGSSHGKPSEHLEKECYNCHKKAT
ncbi:hypothetical protein PILCRDRAFT_828602 [Piloderma croceum F 1598]|uniref:Uncharacterized protein n=1 Tax=Piloderma croceum (strain F 1598) TaxID=765440 RepID=A0A0C3EN70_PILCF|nr:hypothetical protein PILCRDRAFT_828602 [Piloderma croceum F 1598]